MAMPKMDMNPIAADTEKFVARDDQREDASRARDGDVDEHDERVDPVADGDVHDEPDEQDRQRDDERRAALSTLFSSSISPAQSRCMP